MKNESMIRTVNDDNNIWNDIGESRLNPPMLAFK